MKKKIAIIAVALCLVIALVALCACTPSVKSLRSKYEKKGYTCEDIKAEDVGEEFGEDIAIDYAFYAIDKDLNSVTVVAFKNKDDADKVEERLKKADDSIIGEWTKVTYARKGNAIAYGSEAAVELF